MTIDWEFIASLEGAEVLHGYVPVSKSGEVVGKSGVTVGTVRTAPAALAGATT